MGIFFPSDPDYFPNERKTGFPRYAQVLERDWKRFFLVDLLTLATLIPFAAGVILSIATSSVLVLIPGCIIGGSIAGPGMACMYDCILRSLRDNTDDWWFNYKKAFRQNLGASMLPGILMCLFIGFLAFACALLWWSNLPITGGTVAILLFSALIVTMVFTIWWPQIVLFSQKPGLQLKNCLLFMIQYFWKTLGAAALQLVWWAVMVLFMPWTAFVVPFLGVWYILYVSLFLLYDKLDYAFKIEEQIARSFPEQVPVYGEE